MKTLFLRYRKAQEAVAWQEVGARIDGGATHRRRHLFRMTGLLADTSYVYEIRDQAGAKTKTASGEFRTATPPGQGKVRFAVFGDSGKIPWWTFSANRTGLDIADWLKNSLPGRGHQWQLAKRIVDERVDLVLHLGDLVYPWGRREDFPEAVFLPFEKLMRNAAFYPSVGNHDLLSQGGKWLIYFFEAPQKGSESGGRYYSFVHGPVQFICLDTFSPGFPLVKGKKQWRWLEQVLAGPDFPWRVVFTHRPLWTASRSRFDSENKRLREQLHPLLAAGGVDFVFSGHDHLYQRYPAKDGVNYVVAGAGGKDLYVLHDDPELAHWNNTEFSFGLVDASAGRIELKVITERGRLIERLVLLR